jgi:hypothetical protein
MAEKKFLKHSMESADPPRQGVNMGSLTLEMIRPPLDSDSGRDKFSDRGACRSRS